uniref:Mediator of RNA polymerase II transcription subunit 18 n=1 Tax=Steinernema glaseri TaxID=37863 RepID=A0A1I8A927_9BILA
MDPTSQSTSVVFGHPGTAGFQPTPASSYQSKEVVLYGSILDSHHETLLQRLKGLCDPGHIRFYEHEMVFCLKTGHDPDVTVRMRRKHKDPPNSNTHNVWHMRYVGGPEPDATCPTIVRKCIDSVIQTPVNTQMMEFVKALGLRIDFEYLSQGYLFTKQNVKVIIERMQKTEKTGSYHEQDLKYISDSHLVTLTMSLPENSDYLSAAKYLREFGDQLAPLTQMEKIDYWIRKPML